MPTTANYSWTTPTVGGSTGSWGTILNTLADDIDAALFTVEGKADDGIADAAAAQATADAALPKAGGVMTGRLDAHSSSLKTVTASGSGSIALDLATGNYFVVTTSGNITFSFSNVPSGSFVTGILVLVNAGGAHSVTWPASVKWPGGTTPTQTASKIDVYALITHDNGTTWRAVRVIRDSL